MRCKFSSAASLFAGVTATILAATTLTYAQQPSAPRMAPPSAPAIIAPQAPQPAARPAAPSPELSNLNPFPPVNPKLFTSDSVSVDVVNAFLKQLWGYDPNRIWQVAEIAKTEAPGITKVVVYVTTKGSTQKVTGTQFFVTPDGKHAIADAVMSFGATPFADARKELQARADGAARGAASKDLLLVEFSDLQCPHCKEAEPIMDKLVKDFPNARVVYQSFPLVEIHPAAFKAAAYGYCVEKKSEAAFFQYAQAVFDTQDALTPEKTDETLNNAVTKAGQNPTDVAACAATAATKASVDGSVKLAQDLGVTSTPTLFVNGRPLPLTSVPYELLKNIISFQAVQDGVSTGASASSAAAATIPASAPTVK